MIDGVPLIAAHLSAAGILGVAVLMVLTGRLATRREVDAEKARADTWQDAWQTERARNDVAFEHIGELAENSRTTVRTMDALYAQVMAYDQVMGGDSP